MITSNIDTIDTTALYFSLPLVAKKRGTKWKIMQTQGKHTDSLAHNSLLSKKKNSATRGKQITR